MVTLEFLPFGTIINIHCVSSFEELDRDYDMEPGYFKSYLSGEGRYAAKMINPESNALVVAIILFGTDHSSGEIAKLCLHALHYIYQHEGLVWDIWEDHRKGKELEWLVDEVFSFILDIEEKVRYQ